MASNRSAMYHLADLLQMDLMEEEGFAINGSKRFKVKDLPIAYTMNVERSYSNATGVGIYASVRNDLYAFITVGVENGEGVNRVFLINKKALKVDPKFPFNATYNEVFKQLEPGVAAIFKKEQKSKRWTQVR